MKKQKEVRRVILLFFIALLISFVATFPFSFASQVDWISQHTVFPEYFRTLFLKTGTLLPTFAFHIGGGQNLFYFSYYGLLAPWVLLSYVFSFVPMKLYVSVFFLFSYSFDGLLCYRFLKKHFSEKIAFQGSLLFLLSTSLLFHSHRHIMFVSYFPFLFLAFCGIDQYFKTRKTFFFTVQISLLLFTNYYFAISCLLALGCYALFILFSFPKQTRKSILSLLFPLLRSVFIAILTASILLLPTFLALISGRSGTPSVSLFNLLLPNLNLANFFYDPYGLGLSFLSFFSLFFLLFQKEKRMKVFAFFLLFLCTSSFLLYLLNGGAYIRAKVLLPFLPLFVYATACFLSTFSHRKKQYLLSFLLFLFLFFLSLWNESTRSFSFLLLLDYSFFLVFYKTPKKVTFLFLLVFLSLLTIFTSRSDLLLPLDTFLEKQEKKIQKNYQKLPLTPLYRTSSEGLSNVNQVFSLDTSSPFLYSSLSNENYHSFYQTFFHSIPNRNQLMLTSSVNLFYDTILGVRYRYGKIQSSFYQKIGDHLYQNPYAFPIFYGNTKLMGTSEYEKLTDQEKMEALLSYTVVENAKPSSYLSSLHPASFPFVLEDKVKEKLNLHFENGKLVVEPKKDYTFHLPLSYSLQDEILLLRLPLLNQTSCKTKDRTLTIEGQTNKITCSSHLYKNENMTLDFLLSTSKKEVDLKITEGKYVFEEAQVYLLGKEVFQEEVDGKILPENFEWEQTYDAFTFTLDMNQDGYFTSSIPYDTGFVLKIDGKEVPIQKVNTAFLGAPLSKGKHTLTLSFVPKGLVLGKILTSLGIFFLFLLFLKEKFTCKLPKKICSTRNN